jgi:tight adherence protein B
MNPDFILIGCFLASFVAVSLFVWFGFQLFGKGWQSYEEKYVRGAERTLDAMYLTMPAQHIIYLSFASLAAAFGLAMLAFRNLTLASIMGIIAFPLPGLIVQILKKRRDKMFNRQLVDALVGMGNALRAGFSLPLAFELLAREMPNPMGQEMRLLTQQMRVGVTMDDALRELYNRMPSEDLDLLISSILISREVGGNLTEIFDNIADTVRERHRLEGKIASMTAQGKLQGIVVSLLPVAIGIFMYVFNPQLMQPMFQHWLGIVMIIGTVILLGAGAFFIYKVTRIDI